MEELCRWKECGGMDKLGGDMKKGGARSEVIKKGGEELDTD